jgi:predicted dehydrogenase
MEPTLREAIALIREAAQALREGVVQAVMRRNRLYDEVKRLDLVLTDLRQKLAAAEKAGNSALGAQLRQEIELRDGELERTRALLTQAETEADLAKQRLPEEEARLARQLNDLQARFAQNAAAQATGELPGAVSEAESLWDRASAKVDALRREASAREEVATVGRPGLVGANKTEQTADQSAEALLAEMERRLGMPSTGAPQVAIPGANERAYFLELDAPASTVTPNPPTQPPILTVAADDMTSVTRDATVDVDRVKADQDSLAPPETNAPAVRITVPYTKGDNSLMESTQRVRVAAIGTGGIFRGAHCPCYPEIAQMQLVALCDPDKNAQNLAYKRYQSLVEARIKRANEANDVATAERLERDLETVQICDDISEVIESVKPDLVDICTQPLLHTPLSIQALEAGIHVMCEKPISRSWLESQRLIEAIKRTGKFYQHNENWLFDPDYYTVKKLVDSGAIGELVAMFLTQAHGGPEGNPKFWDSNYGGGGSLLDNGIHAIGAAWYIAGLHKRPTLVKAAEPFGMSIRMPDRIIDGRYRKVTVDDDAHILIRFEDEKTNAWTTAHVEGSWSEQDSPDTVYIGTTGRIEMRNDEDGKRYAVITDAHGSSNRRFRVSGSNWQFWPSSFYGEILKWWSVSATANSRS